jgi:tetratricopeptide (TPR) repeat protein
MMLRKSWLLGAAACAWASGAAAQAPSAQQQFEAANKALAESRWADALAGYEKVERVMSRDVQGRAVIRLRKGEALANLRRHPEARAAIAGALAELPANDAGTREDRLIGHLVLGEITERALDYGEAAKQFRAAELLAEGSADKLRALRGLTATTLFFNGAEALGHVDRALALVAQQAPGNKALTASLKTLRGRVLMNLARHAEARTELEAAVALLGGLTTRVDIADLSARSDLSLTLLLMGQKDAARKYLAYTGAGRLEQELGFGAEMTPPVCGEAGWSRRTWPWWSSRSAVTARSAMSRRFIRRARDRPRLPLPRRSAAGPGGRTPLPRSRLCCAP